MGRFSPASRSRNRRSSWSVASPRASTSSRPLGFSYVRASTRASRAAPVQRALTSRIQRALAFFRLALSPLLGAVSSLSTASSARVVTSNAGTRGGAEACGCATSSQTPSNRPPTNTTPRKSAATARAVRAGFTLADHPATRHPPCPPKGQSHARRVARSGPVDRGSRLARRDGRRRSRLGSGGAAQRRQDRNEHLPACLMTDYLLPVIGDAVRADPVREHLDRVVPQERVDGLFGQPPPRPRTACTMRSARSAPDPSLRPASPPSRPG